MHRLIVAVSSDFTFKLAPTRHADVTVATLEYGVWKFLIISHRAFLLSGRFRWSRSQFLIGFDVLVEVGLDILEVGFDILWFDDFVSRVKRRPC